MSLGFDAISALPFATAQTAGDVQVVVSGNQLTIGIGNPAISADSITEIPDPNRLTLGLGTLTITADSNFTATGSQVVLNTNLPAANVSTSVDFTPSVNQLTLATGNVTISADCNIDVNSGLTTTSFALDTGEVSAITWSEIIPGVTMTWTPIDTN
jgi:hypothetical protein